MTGDPAVFMATNGEKRESGDEGESYMNIHERD